MQINFARYISLGVIAVLAIAVAGQDASAQNLSRLSCGQLWYERNSIYAQFGYCFKTDQAIRTFGRRCHSPYGRLPGWAQSRVDEIQSWESRKSCN